MKWMAVWERVGVVFFFVFWFFFLFFLWREIMEETKRKENQEKRVFK